MIHRIGSMKQAALVLTVTSAVAIAATRLMAQQAGINELARNVERAEAIRAVKTLQRSFAQYSQFGLWNEMAGLFSTDAVYIWGDDKANGRKGHR